MKIFGVLNQSLQNNKMKSENNKNMYIIFNNNNLKISFVLKINLKKKFLLFLNKTSFALLKSN